MDTETPTYTRTQAMVALGIKSPSTFHHLRNKYPYAFVVIQPGTKGRGNQTLYNKPILDQFIQARTTLQSMKGKQS